MILEGSELRYLPHGIFVVVDDICSLDKVARGTNVSPQIGSRVPDWSFVWRRALRLETASFCFSLGCNAKGYNQNNLSPYSQEEKYD